MNKPLMRDKAYDRIKRGILSGEFDTDGFLSEQRVAKRLRMSKTPVSDAFTRLELEGLVKVAPRQGIMIRELNVKEIHDHFGLRIAIESAVVSGLCDKPLANECSELEANLEEQQRCVQDQSIERSVELDGEFHVLLSQLHGNEEIVRIMRQLQDKIYRISHRVHQQNPDRLGTNFPEHRALLDAIKKQDKERATELVIHHLNSGRKLLLGV